MIVTDSDDMKHRTEDAFQLITPEQAIAWLCVVILIAYIFWPELK